MTAKDVVDDKECRVIVVYVRCEQSPKTHNKHRNTTHTLGKGVQKTKGRRQKKTLWWDKSSSVYVQNSVENTTVGCCFFCIGVVGVGGRTRRVAACPTARRGLEFVECRSKGMYSFTGNRQGERREKKGTAAAAAA